MSDLDEPFLIPSELTPTFSNNHLQYAITWFVMSFAFFVLFLVYLKKNGQTPIWNYPDNLSFI